MRPHVITGDAETEAIEAHLETTVKDGRINSWWIPDSFEVIDEFPLTSTGKIRKSTLLDRLGLD